jgi:EAL domain-containing protein (putative c-di-GMP-specific phosphodiesterase class I)
MELDAIVACGCDLVQGYYYARPMPGLQLTAWLDEHAIAFPR